MAEKSILVVEDEPDISLLIKRSLDMKKFKVRRAQSGAGALEFLAKTKPDLILLDIMMPDIDGFEVCKRIKQNPDHEHIPVVFLTVRSNKEDIRRGQALGAAGYFTKPFDPFKLGDEIEKILA